jgi:hypothetical protein
VFLRPTLSRVDRGGIFGLTFVGSGTGVLVFSLLRLLLLLLLLFNANDSLLLATAGASAFTKLLSSSILFFMGKERRIGWTTHFYTSS